MDEHQFMKDFLNNIDCDVPIDISPTIISWEHTIIMMKKKYGDNWFDNEFAKMIVVWNSFLFDRDHVKEVCLNYNGLYELCDEYFTSQTMLGKPLPCDFHWKILNFMMNYNPIEPEITGFQSSPVRNTFWDIKN